MVPCVKLFSLLDLQSRRGDGAKVSRVEIAVPMHLKGGGSKDAVGTVLRCLGC